MGEGISIGGGRLGGEGAGIAPNSLVAAMLVRIGDISMFSRFGFGGCFSHRIGTPFLSHSTARSSSPASPLALVPLWLTSNALERDWLRPCPELDNVEIPNFFAIVGRTTSSQSASFGGVKLDSGGTQ